MPAAGKGSPRPAGFLPAETHITRAAFRGRTPIGMRAQWSSRRPAGCSGQKPHTAAPRPFMQDYAMTPPQPAPAAAAARSTDARRRSPSSLADAAACRSEAAEDFAAAHLVRAAGGADHGCDESCDHGGRIDEASGPDRGAAAVGGPGARGLEHDTPAAKASGQIIGHGRARAGRAGDENPAEISSRVGAQNLEDRAPLTLPDRREQALGRSCDNGGNQKKQSDDDTIHAVPLRTDGGMGMIFLHAKMAKRSSRWELRQIIARRSEQRRYPVLASEGGKSSRGQACECGNLAGRGVATAWIRQASPA